MKIDFLSLLKNEIPLTVMVEQFSQITVEESIILQDFFRVWNLFFPKNAWKEETESEKAWLSTKLNFQKID